MKEPFTKGPDVEPGYKQSWVESHWVNIGLILLEGGIIFHLLTVTGPALIEANAAGEPIGGVAAVALTEVLCIGLGLTALGA